MATRNTTKMLTVSPLLELVKTLSPTIIHADTSELTMPVSPLPQRSPQDPKLDTRPLPGKTPQNRRIKTIFFNSNHTRVEKNI